MVQEVLSSMSLDLHMSFFNLIMKSNVTLAMGLPYTMNPMIKLWKSLASSWAIAHKMLEYVKLAKFAMVQVIGLVEDKRWFNNLNFIKSKFCNQLTTHFELVVQQFYKLKLFPYLQAIVAWKEMGAQYGFDA